MSDPSDRAVDDALAAIASHREAESLLARVAEVLVGHGAGDGAFVWLVHETGDRIEAVAGVGPDRGLLVGRVRRRGEGVAGCAWEGGRTVLVEDVTRLRDVRPEWRAGTSLCAVPLADAEGVHGLLMVSARAGAVHLAGAVPTIERVARIASMAVSNLRLAETANAELRRTRALGALGDGIDACEDPAADADALCRGLLDAFEVDRASLHLADAHGALVQHVSWRRGPEGLEPSPPIPAELLPETILGWAHATGREGIVRRDSRDPRESARVHLARPAIGLASTVCAPVTCGGVGIGVLAVGRGTERPDLDENAINVFRALVARLNARLERGALVRALEHRAFHDGLTGLANRDRFEATLAATLGAPGARGAVLFVDLDGFKPVNDTLGHAAGDRLLREVGARLGTCAAEGELLARMGGDEFALIVHGPPARAERIATELLAALGTGFEIGGAAIGVGASVGIGLFPEDGDTVETLVRSADLAMYRAKREGKGRALRYDRSFADVSLRRAGLEVELREAIDRGRFALAYQPQVSTVDGRVAGVEALIRWEHPARGTISPAEFVPIAEEAGLMDAIGTWVLDEAIGQLGRWRGTPLEGLRVGINVAAAQLLAEDFVERAPRDRPEGDRARGHRGRRGPRRRGGRPAARTRARRGRPDRDRRLRYRLLLARLAPGPAARHPQDRPRVRRAPRRGRARPVARQRDPAPRLRARARDRRRGRGDRGRARAGARARLRLRPGLGARAGRGAGGARGDRRGDRGTDGGGRAVAVASRRLRTIRRSQTRGSAAPAVPSRSTRIARKRELKARR